MARVIVQKGHAFRTKGATGTNGEQRPYADQCGDELARRLRASGHEARIILADEPIPAGRWDVFIALHADGSTSARARGASVGYRTTDGSILAQAWKRWYQQHGFPSGFRPDNYTSGLSGYYGTRQAVARGIRHAVITEAGFLTNPDDRAWIFGNIARCAQAHVDAVNEIFTRPPVIRPEPDEWETFMASLTPRQQQILTELAVTIEEENSTGHGYRHLLHDFRARRDAGIGPVHYRALVALEDHLTDVGSSIRGFARWGVTVIRDYREKNPTLKEL